MKKAILLTILVAFSLVPLFAQEISTATVYHPGDPIRVLVTIKAPASVTSAGFNFGHVGEVEKGQEALQLSFSHNEFKNLSDTKFEISGVLPQHIAAGTYKLNIITIVINGVAKNYSHENGDFRELTVTVLNPELPIFPKIDDVKIAP
jgi:hypothetical protein